MELSCLVESQLIILARKSNHELYQQHLIRMTYWLQHTRSLVQKPRKLSLLRQFSWFELYILIYAVSYSLSNLSFAFCKAAFSISEISG